jgi:hypothetical protein
MRSLLCGVIALAWFATAAEAARPDVASDCALFTTLEFGSGQLLEVRGLACRASGQPPRVTVRERRVIDPALILRQGLIW